MAQRRPPIDKPDTVQGKRMRLPKLTYDELTPEQKKVWDEVVAGPRKRMHGPFFAWLHSPELLSSGQTLGLYARFQSGLPQRLSELCILITSAHWKASGEWVDHVPIARDLGVDADALEALRTGKPVKFKQDDEGTVYALARELLNTHEVSDATYKRAEDVLGQKGVLDIIAVLGYYGLIAMTLKAFKMQPESVADPFADIGRAV